MPEINPAATLALDFNALIDDNPHLSWPLVAARAGLTPSMQNWLRWNRESQAPRIKPIHAGSILFVLGYQPHDFRWPFEMVLLNDMDTPATFRFDMAGVVDFALMRGLTKTELVQRAGITLNMLRGMTDERREARKFWLYSWNCHTVGSVLAVLGIRPSPPFYLIVHEAQTYD